MDQEIETFKENVDAWIKQIHSEYSTLSSLPRIVTENIDNTEHNYELIYELKEEIEELKEELNALKLIQIISIRENAKIQKRNS